MRRISANGGSWDSADIVVPGLSDPAHLAIDVLANMMCWTDTEDDKIYCSDLEGNDLHPVTVTGNTPQGIAIDSVGGKIYWTEWSPGKIRRVNFDGTGREDLIDTASTTPTGIVVHVTSGG